MSAHRTLGIKAVAGMTGDLVDFFHAWCGMGDCEFSYTVPVSGA